MITARKAIATVYITGSLHFAALPPRPALFQQHGVGTSERSRVRLYLAAETDPQIVMERKMGRRGSYVQKCHHAKCGSCYFYLASNMYLTKAAGCHLEIAIGKSHLRLHFPHLTRIKYPAFPAQPSLCPSSLASRVTIPFTPPPDKERTISDSECQSDV